jgi:hypothetical protein
MTKVLFAGAVALVMAALIGAATPAAADSGHRGGRSGHWSGGSSSYGHGRAWHGRSVPHFQSRRFDWHGGRGFGWNRGRHFNRLDHRWRSQFHYRRPHYRFDGYRW